MRKRVIGLLALLLAAIIIAGSFSGCILDQSEYNYLFEYWFADWYGWYEVTDATGKYAGLAGLRSDIKANSGMTQQAQFIFDIGTLDDERLFDFLGAYGHEPENQFGMVSLDRIRFADAFLGDIPIDEDEEVGKGFIPAAFTVDGEAHGLRNLAVVKCSVGKGKDILRMEVYLRQWGTRWEDLRDYTGDAFGGRAYSDCLPEGYASYLTTFEEDEFLDATEDFWKIDRLGQYTVTDATGSLAAYAAEQTECGMETSVSCFFDTGRYRHDYHFVLKPTDPDKAETFRIYFSGKWEPEPENQLGIIRLTGVHICGEDFEIEGTAEPSRELPGIMVIRAKVFNENDSLTFTALLRPQMESPEDA